MKIKIEFNTDTPAFDDYGDPFEIGRIFQAIQTDICKGGRGSQIRDINGNTIGVWSWD